MSHLIQHIFISDSSNNSIICDMCVYMCVYVCIYTHTMTKIRKSKLFMDWKG